MSSQSALQFVAKAAQDETLLGKIRAATGITGDFAPGQITDDQYSVAAKLAHHEGFEATPDEIKNSLEKLMGQQELSEQELADAELDLVAGGFATNKAGMKKGQLNTAPPIQSLPSQQIGGH